MTTDLNTLLTALYVKIDDYLGHRTRLGRPPKLALAVLPGATAAPDLHPGRAAPTDRNRAPRPDEHLLKPVRQLIESVNDTLKGQLDLELHGGRGIDGVGAGTTELPASPLPDP